MNKINKSLMLSICMFMSFSIQARSLVAITTGSLVATAGIMSLNVALQKMGSFWQQVMSDPKEKKRTEQLLIGGGLATFGGLIVLGCGAGR